MPESIEILKMRILLCFLSEEPSRCTVTGLAEMLGEHKQKISRMLIAMEREALINRDDLRHPALTQSGKALALFYEERTNIILNHLLYEGLDIDKAEQNAYAWALYSSEEAVNIIRASEQIYRAKYELRKQHTFYGDTLCMHLGEGEYRCPFLIYREHVKDGSNLSMANEGFAHPCRLIIKNGTGNVYLQAVNVTAMSKLNGAMMRGHVRSMQYLGSDGEFTDCKKEDNCFVFPISSMSFINMGDGIGQVLHGSICIKVQCSVGTNHMPESKAIFTIII